MPVSDIEVIKPSDLDNASTEDSSGDDVIIRELASDNQVLSQSVKALLALGPYSYFVAGLSGAPTITASTDAVVNLTSDSYGGLYNDTDWYPGTNPESIVIPESGIYMFFVTAELADGVVAGQAYVNLVADPAGTPVVVARSSVLTGGTSAEVSTSFVRIVQLSQYDEIGIQFVNDGLSDYTVSDSFTQIIVVKIG